MKFASEAGGEWLPHDFGKVYAHERTSTQPRLGIAASFDGTALLRELTLALAEPFLMLYVLVVPRGRAVPGRYQSDELSRAELDSLFDRFAPFWDSDGRHNIWVRSSDEGMLVYDRHNLIYRMGRCSVSRARLGSSVYDGAILVARFCAPAFIPSGVRQSRARVDHPVRR